MLNTIASIFGAWLFADFITGIAHWAQDRILVPSKNAFANSVIADNVLHHDKPAAMLKFSFYENIRVATYVMWPLSLFFYLFGSPMVVWLGFFFGAFGNGIHWFSHQRRVHPVVKLLQRCGLFCSFKHHSQHHMSDEKLVDRSDASIKYCVMTNWVNPVLDKMKFFRILESIFKKTDKTLPENHQHGTASYL